MEYENDNESFHGFGDSPTPALSPTPEGSLTPEGSQPEGLSSPEESSSDDDPSSSSSYSELSEKSSKEESEDDDENTVGRVHPRVQLDACMKHTKRMADEWPPTLYAIALPD